MKKSLIVLVCLLLPVLAPVAQISQSEAKSLEYAIVKWDGPDRLSYNLPDKFQLVQVTKDRKVAIPKEAQEEEFCLAYAVNDLAKDGWEPINLNSRRILFRRVKN
jgi:hypothetical protein